MSFVERIKLSNEVLHPHFSIFFGLGVRAILVLKIGIENSSFFFIHFFSQKKKLPIYDINLSAQPLNELS